jgi:hypothetical protein
MEALKRYTGGQRIGKVILNDFLYSNAISRGVKQNSITMKPAGSSV